MRSLQTPLCNKSRLDLRYFTCSSPHHHFYDRRKRFNIQSEFHMYVHFGEIATNLFTNDTFRIADDD